MLFFKGLIFGLAIAAAVGPISLLCIRRTLNHGAVAGLATGMGAAFADAVYGAVAAFGLTSVSYLLIEQQTLLKWAGGFALVLLGLRGFWTRPTLGAAKISFSGLASAFGACFFLTLANPTTILSFVAAFAALGLGDYVGGWAAGALLVLGVFIGSSLWWVILSSAVARLRRHIRQGGLIAIHRGSSLMLIAFGLFAWWSALTH